MAEVDLDLPTGRVVGRFIVEVQDNNDRDTEPQLVPATGEVTIKSSIEHLQIYDSEHGNLITFRGPHKGVVDSEGRLSTPIPDSSEPMYRDMVLWSNDSDNLSVKGWTYTATFNLKTLDGRALALPAITFELATGQVYDLARGLKVPSTPGYGLPQAEASALRAEAIAQSVRDDANNGLLDGEAATLEIGQVVSGSIPKINNVGNNHHAVLNFVLPKGDAGVGVPEGGVAGQYIEKTSSGDTQWAEPPTINPRSYGVTGDGVTDDTEAAQSAIDNAFGFAVRFTAGDYRLSKLVLRSNSRISIDAGATLHHAAAGELFSASGTEAATATLLSAEGVLQGSKTIVAPGHGLSPGDTFRLASAKMFDERSTGSSHGELLVVDSVNGGTINTVTAIAGNGYGSGNAAYIRKVVMVENIIINGGGTILGAKTPGLGQFGVKVSLGRGVRVEGVMFKDLDRRHIWFADCIDAWANWNRFDWAVDELQAYGVVFSDASQDSGALRNVYNGLRHAFTTSNTSAVSGIPRRILFAYNTVNQTSAALGGSQAGGDAIDTHTAAEDIWIENNTVNGSLGAGINFEAASGRIIGNFVTDTVANGIYVHNESDQRGTMTITQNEVRRAGGYGIYARTGGRGTTQQYEHLNVSYNLVTRSNGSGIVVGDLSSTPSTPPEEGVMVIGNTLHRIVGSYALAIGNCTDFVQRDNRAIRGTTNTRFPTGGDGGSGDHPGFLFQVIATDSVSVTPATRYLRVDTAASAALDSLTTINGGSRGQVITVTTSSNGRDVEIGTTGNIRILSPLTLALARSSITLGFDGTYWREQSRADFGS